jgi:hypothetical protein
MTRRLAYIDRHLYKRDKNGETIAVTIIGASLLFEKRDAWIGVYPAGIERRRWTNSIDVYVCLIPFFPIKFFAIWNGNNPDAPRHVCINDR